MIALPRRVALAIATPLLLAGTACSVSSSQTTVAIDVSTPSTDPESTSMRGLRYCEVLLLDLGDEGLRAEVYNSFPLSECDEKVWGTLDGGAIAAVEKVPFALLNGPRFWLMDSVEKLDDGSVIAKTFSGSGGSIDMNRYAVVVLGAPDTIGKAYVPQSVDRRSRFFFRAGSTIHVITDDTGSKYVMQSWSQQRDPLLDEDGLVGLADRLSLPAGWTFSVEVLDSDLVLDSTGGPARVFQDELMNTYSLIDG